MTVSELCGKLSLKPLSMPEPERSFEGGYAGDLLSWVMGRAHADCVWATIMTNVNIVAVASLADVAAVVVCENSDIDEGTVKTALEKDVNLLKTSLPMYEFCVKLAELQK